MCNILQFYNLKHTLYIILITPVSYHHQLSTLQTPDSLKNFQNSPIKDVLAHLINVHTKSAKY